MEVNGTKDGHESGSLQVPIPTGAGQVTGTNTYKYLQVDPHDPDPPDPGTCFPRVRVRSQVVFFWVQVPVQQVQVYQDPDSCPSLLGIDAKVPRTLPSVINNAHLEAMEHALAGKNYGEIKSDFAEITHAAVLPAIRECRTQQIRWELDYDFICDGLGGAAAASSATSAPKSSAGQAFRMPASVQPPVGCASAVKNC
ncbi:hypothetical protein BDP27DRAFT_1424926 [Rhodocollybia butyracea]|uniref:Uncharacterized protein n=1 Tax=Rhodocollybia butyracea TaxID=206335 RepID=A0A9P5PK49_9AGAR|nr:hypothetical protein BDP27DRAFT_1424926 [Rhodocollybia butyracea]